MTDPLSVMGAVGVTLYAAHSVGDYWVQTDYQATHKMLSGLKGHWACFCHVFTYTLTALCFLLAMQQVTGLRLSMGQWVAGLFVYSSTHYIADRRSPLRWLAKVTGKINLWNLGSPRTGKDDNLCVGTGYIALDQSWHYFWIFVSALVMSAS